MGIFIVACSPSGSAENAQKNTPALPDPKVYTTSVPKAESTALAFLEGWQVEDYDLMYDLISPQDQANVSKEQFVQRYIDVANEVALSGIKFDILSIQINPESAEIEYRIILQSAVVNDIARDYKMTLEIENGDWRIKWDDTLILPELAGGNYLRLDRETSRRAGIYDRSGNPLAAQHEAVAIGLWPDYVDLEESKGLLSLLSLLTNYKSYTIAGMIEDAYPGDYLALGEVPADQNQRELNLLSTYGAAVTSNYDRRLYYGGGIAPHVVGYISAIQEEEMNEYLRQGFRSDDRVGRKGLELWGDEILGGVNGGTLFVFNPEGKPIAELGAAPSQPGQDIYTTIDAEFQRQTQKALSVFNGAIVVLERDTGRVLAIASSPGFDPNAFETDNYNWNTLLNDIINNQDSPQFNRATQGQYPLGSVFKLITMAAALESGRYIDESTYECGYVFDELPGFPRYDWTYDHFLEDGETQPSGFLTLAEGLIRSCNPFFWNMGLDLYNNGFPTAIAEMSKGFGLGSPTGIDVLEEESGVIPEPNTEVDAINLAIGQGDMLVTPLQVARFVAALGNGGTLYRPQIIEGIAPPGSTITSTFEADPQETLPLSPQNLKIIQDAMVGVVRSTNPPGTAIRPFRGLEINVAGKTGSATSPSNESHAWFAGYTFEEREERPDIAAVVIAENSGEGSEIAAPIFRRIVELYFFEKPLRVYPWEAIFDVTRSPTPILTDTPTPQSSLSP